MMYFYPDFPFVLYILISCNAQINATLRWSHNELDGVSNSTLTEGQGSESFLCF